ncbi:polymorphic toxin-type HINT domain-containing protein [Actinacidiphila sp. DG2A-62]|uniref:polymorphic toxin-type HINT domain-containing protein n=1 Tax=Actinacidiphila sp. DG2A-62 TaxID=3108821 RepID=UPI002DBCB865|nr:polymorphic toxin-type HINT domain-containing protein [Actinacidiphila sp. DG2A-62]MEC3994458.1 polymorphic toxin-type HINT domain-containing protein [Actinacidiphila sp. DG2A-62]
MSAQAARDVAAQKAAKALRAKRAVADQKAAWPERGEATGVLDGTRHQLVAGGLPVAVSGRAATKQAAADGRLRIDTLGSASAEAAGVHGVLFSATAVNGMSGHVDVGYGAFASAYGGGWAGRLRMVRLPACALTTPRLAACRVRTPLPSHNDVLSRTVTADINLPADKADRAGTQGTAPAASPVVLALTADMSGESPTGSGTYAATALSSESTWAAGSSSGSFTWSYDFGAPPAAAGPQPKLGLSYDSGSVDGRTSSTNNQGSVVGEGFDLTSSYIERSYATCDDDGTTDKQDLCWKFDNASLVLNGASTELVRDDTSGVWRLKDDDASTVVHSTGADNGDAGDATIDGAGEYWTITTGDGTRYVFGLNKLPGATTQRTNSVWTVPVFGNDPNEPGYTHGTGFSGRAVTQAWRWNLDYVVDLHGNAMSYWYTPETNYYAQNGASTATAAYTRGGYLTEIHYGQRSDTLFSGTYSDKIVFGYDERCLATDCSSLTKDTAARWPDVPFDAICASGATCDATGPSFFTRKRLTRVETSAWSATGAAYKPVDRWDLVQEFLDEQELADSSDQILILDSIRRTGENGTSTLSLPPTTFTYQSPPNRVDGAADDILPYYRPRIATITTETGARTKVTLSTPECHRGGTMPASEDQDTKSCFPQYWHINGAETAGLDWFNKYSVKSVTVSDTTAGNLDLISSYTYGDPAWHYDDDPFTPADERTWSRWRGYGTVTVTSGNAATTSKTTSVYLQGMNGDKQKGTSTPRSATVAGVDLPGLDVADQTDSDPYASFLREKITYDGPTAVSVVVNDPWSRNTATQHKSYADVAATYVRTARTRTSTYLTATSSWRTRSVGTTYDDYGMATEVDDSGQLGVSGDETCTRTWYARNTAADVGITALVSRTRVTGRDCSTAENDLDLPTGTANRGDVLSDTATVYDNTSATAWSAGQTPTKGQANWTGRAASYPATATGGERNPTAWQTVATVQYDTDIATDTVKLGRPRVVTDAAGASTTTVYTPAGVGPLTKTAVTNAANQNSYTYLDPGRGSLLKSYDVDLKITENTYDALGRVTATWLPDRSHAGQQTASYVYAYGVSNTLPSWTSTGAVHDNDGGYTTSYSLYDALLRPIQTQSPTPLGGRLLTRTEYDSRGLPFRTSQDVFDDTSAPDGTFQTTDPGQVPKYTQTAYDGVGRPTTSTFSVFGDLKWTTTSSYTGDSVASSALQGGSAVRTITDVLGRTVEQRQYASTSPADAQYGAGAGAAYTSTKFSYTRDGKQATITGPDSTRWTYAYDVYGRQTSSTDPDSGTTTTGYDTLDRAVWTKDADGSVVATAYDKLGRPTGTYDASAATDSAGIPAQQTPQNQLTGYVYDSVAKGQLTSSTRYVGGNTTGGRAYTTAVSVYDARHRPTTTTLTLDKTDPLVTSGATATTYTFHTGYNPDGTPSYSEEPAAAGLPDESLTPAYDAVGLPTALSSGSGGYVLATSYSALGQVDQLTLGVSNALTVKHLFVSNTYEEGTDRLTQSRVTDQTHPYDLQSLGYTYDDAGDVTSVEDEATLGGTGAADNQCFSYDGHQRLAQAWTPTDPDCSAAQPSTGGLGGASPYWTSYAYTAGGLRSTQTDHTASGDVLSTYCYDPARPHALTAVLTASATCDGVPAAYTYDGAGDTTTRPHGGGTQDLAWDVEGNLSQLKEKSGSAVTSTTDYVYDAQGRLLIRRNVDGETVLYLDGATEIHTTSVSGKPVTWGQRTYVFDGQPVAARTTQTGMPGLTWLAGDQHGTSSLAVDTSANQNPVKRYLTPFGAPRAGGSGTWPDDKSFLGAPADTGTGLTQLGARQYDPATGRFLSVDPLLTASDPQALNGYTYADDNPVTLSDPAGTRIEECGTGAATCSGDNHHVNDATTTADTTCAHGGCSDSAPHGSQDPADTAPPSTVEVYPTVVVPRDWDGWLDFATALDKRIAKDCEFQDFYCDDPSQYDREGARAGVTQTLTTDVFMACSDIGGCPATIHGAGAGAVIAANAAALSGPGDVAGEGDLFKTGNGRSLKGGTGCNSFRPDTPVLVEDGKTKKIGDLRVGDQVEAADPDTGKHVGSREVTATHINHDHDLVDVTVETEAGHAGVLHTTSKHPFWDATLHVWVPAGRLKPGHVLETAADQHVRVMAVRLRPGTAEMWNLTVDQLHTYYVLAGNTPVLVHNVGECPIDGVPHGAIGEAASLDRLQKGGYTDITPQVRFINGNGDVFIADFVARNPNGNWVAVESKVGGATVTDHQAVGYPELTSRGAILNTSKLEQYGLKKGSTVTMPLEIDHWRCGVCNP